MRYGIGQRFGRRVITAELGGPFVRCVCDCGSTQVVDKYSLPCTKSCGCWSAEVTAARNTTHGRSGTALYGIWCKIMERCLDENSRMYKNYGGRDIKVCKRWHKFENFLADMGERPSLRHSIERKNNDFGYCKSNCCWATQKEQCNNQRRNIRVEIGGETRTLKQWAELRGLRYLTVYMRIKRGWTPEEALSRASLERKDWSNIKGSRASSAR